MNRLKDKVMLITGGNSGIGRATAILAAQEGAWVVIAARDAGRGQAVVYEIEAAGGTTAIFSSIIGDQYAQQSILT